MSLKRSTVIVLLAVLVLQGAPVSGAPSLTVQSPANNALFATGEVDVKGTAAGTLLSWNESTSSDFGRGSFCSTRANANGTVSLAYGIYDDFNDNSIDESKWWLDTSWMMRVAEENGTLRFNSTGYTAPYGTTTAYATWKMTDKLDADLVFHSPMNITTNSEIGLNIEEDASHYFHLFITSQFGRPAVGVLYRVGGNQMGESAYIDTNILHFSVRSSINGTEINISGFLNFGHRYYMQEANVSLYGYAARDNHIDAAWDNISVGNAFNGTFTSGVRDTGASLSHLKKCDWTAQTPGGTDIRIQYRSSDDKAMANASAWADIAAGDVGGTVALKRYFQYRALLATGDPQTTPLLDSIGFTAYAPIEKVEASADGGQSWTAADGTEQWSARLALPENRSTILVRALDSTGNTTTSSISVDVDLTKPVGSVRINNGAGITESPEVNLSLDAYDKYGVARMRFSEDPDLSGTDWQPYTRDVQFTLSPDEGNKTVFAQFRDTAGWTSEVVKDSIFLDHTLPVGAISIDGGAGYSRTPRVRLNLTAYDIQGVGLMQLSNDAGFKEAEWQAFQGELDWDLIPGNGERTVYARFSTPSLQISETCSDSIVLDTLPPSVNISINDGEPTSNSRSVRIQLNATDNYNVARMHISESRAFDSGMPAGFTPYINYGLSQTDGEKTIYARVWDDAGNEFTTSGDRITLDTTPPAVTIAPLPANQDTLSISLSWEGSDLTTGVASYDVQYRNGTDWHSLLTGYRSNSTKFTGKEGSSYIFRIRATDAAGNTCQFVEAGPVAIVKPDLSPPEVAITAPAAGMTVKGLFAAGGTSRHPVAGKTVQKVQVSLDDGAWADANGTASWSFSMDTKSLADGKHSLRARAYDGRTYSTAAQVNFTVKNAEDGTGGAVNNNFILPGVVAVVITAGAIAGFVFIRKRKAKGS